VRVTIGPQWRGGFLDHEGSGSCIASGLEMENHMTRIARSALTSAATIIGVLGCGQAQPPAPPPPSVTVASVEERPITELDELSGRLEAVDAVEIRPRVSGYIQKVVFIEGTEVKKGDILFQIDPRPYQAELARSEGELAQARSGAALAARNLERARPLAVAEAISREDFDNRSGAAERSAAAVRTAQAALATARLNLEWTRVRSPITGRVGRAEVTLGNLVQPGPTRLTTVVSQDPIHVSFDADERSYLKYAAMGARDRRTRILMGLANEDGTFPHEGYVDFVDNQLDPRTGTVRVRAVFSNKDRRFAPGLFARLKLEGGARYQGTVVSDRAIGTDQDKKFVLVLKPDSTVEYRPVQLGPLVDGYRVVTGGLRAGEQIVINGLQRVRPGMKVAAASGPMLASASASVPSATP
jgi:multidrug efflux system membrane fusion protein